MSQITLRPLDDGQKAVVIPVGKTTIGRGQLLGCSDKKVSRNHAVLEVTAKGEVFLTPTHVNPCFYQPSADNPGQILKKDVPHRLQDGDTFSLLPRAYRYQLSILDSKEQLNDKGKTNGSAVPEDSHQDSASVEPTNNADAEEEEEKPQKEESNDASPPDKSNEEESSNHVRKEEKEPPAEKKEEPSPAPEERKEGGKSAESCEESRDEGTLDTLPSKVSEDEESRPPPKKAGRKKETVVKRKAASGTRGGRKKQLPKFDFDDSPFQRVSGGRTSSRTNRQTRQGLSLEDFVVSDDDEWASDSSPKRRRKKRGPRRKGDESGSDWETDHKKPKKASKGEAGSESGSDWGGITPKKKGGSKGKRRKAKAANESEEEASEPEQSTSVAAAPKQRTPCTYGKKCYRRNQSHVSEFSHPGDSDYESETEGGKEECVKKECPYGANCFRKNAQHKRDFKHTKKVRPQREAAKIADKKTKGSKTSDEVDSYDLNDSFLIDDSADEYKPADSGSDYESGTKKLSKAVARGGKRGRKA